MNQMIVSVRDKMLRRVGGVSHFVTHNKDYEIQFQFDDSWADVRHKMAVFAYEDGEYGSEIFEGDVCSVPELPREGKIYVGVKAGDELSTELLCVQVCKSADDVITDEYDTPDPKIYEQILDIMNNLWGGGDTVYPSPVKFLAAPSAAKVGDLIRVKEVDENGDAEKTVGFDIDAALEKKIDAPGSATVGEMLIVEELDADGKPVKWKTIPQTEITTELSADSTDGQVPSAKTTYEALSTVKDKDAVKFIEQELSETQKQQARENIGTVPKLFWEKREVIAESVLIDDFGSIGYKDIILPVKVKSDYFACDYTYRMYRAGYKDNSNYETSFTITESSDGNSIEVESIPARYEYIVSIVKSTKIFTGVWKITLKISKNSSYEYVQNVPKPTEGMVLDSFYAITIPRALMGGSVALGTTVNKQDESNIRGLYLKPDGFGYVETEISTVTSKENLQSELWNSPRTIIFNYTDAPIDIFWLVSYQYITNSYVQYKGFAMKDGQTGSCRIVSDRGSYLTVQFDSASLGYTIPIIIDENGDVSIEDITYDEFLNACKTKELVRAVTTDGRIFQLVYYDDASAKFVCGDDDCEMGISKDNDGHVQISYFAVISNQINRINIRTYVDDDGVLSYFSNETALSLYYSIFDENVEWTGSAVECCFYPTENDTDHFEILNYSGFSFDELSDGNVAITIKFSSHGPAKHIVVEFKDVVSEFGSEAMNLVSHTITVTENEVLLAPATAQAGQIIKVKSVDDNGKITETEAADFSGSISVAYDEETGNLQIGG